MLQTMERLAGLASAAGGVFVGGLVALTGWKALTAPFRPSRENLNVQRQQAMVQINAERMRALTEIRLENMRQNQIARNQTHTLGRELTN